jgi:serine/threonine-protein kinase
VRRGEWIDGRYRLHELLGRGSFGEVWRAGRVDDDRAVSIKILRESAAVGSDAFERFSREATAAARIQSDRTCLLLEAKTSPPPPFYLVWEHVPGQTLGDLLERENALSFDELSRLLMDVLQGLAAAHDAGVIHRDLKPDNVIVTEDTSGFRARLVDFGVAKLEDDDRDRLTTDGQALGSAAFCAPEQIDGPAEVDPRADLYAVGVIAFYALTGRLPFEAPKPAALLALKLRRTAPTLSEVTGEAWPRGIERWVGALLAREPAARPSTARDALDELGALCRSLRTAPALSTDRQRVARALASTATAQHRRRR